MRNAFRIWRCLDGRNLKTTRLYAYCFRASLTLRRKAAFGWYCIDVALKTPSILAFVYYHTKQFVICSQPCATSVLSKLRFSCLGQLPTLAWWISETDLIIYLNWYVPCIHLMFNRWCSTIVEEFVYHSIPWGFTTSITIAVHLSVARPSILKCRGRYLPCITSFFAACQLDYPCGSGVEIVVGYIVKARTYSEYKPIHTVEYYVSSCNLFL